MTILALLLALQGADLKTEVAGLTLFKGPYGGDDDMRLGNKGTAIHLLVISSDWGLIGVDTEKSYLSKFTDDKGTDLLREKPEYGDAIGSFPRFSKDAKAALVEVLSSATPAAGAKSISLEAKIVVTLAKGQDVIKKEKTEAKQGNKVEAGAVTFEITEAKKPDYGDDPLMVALEVKKNSHMIASVRFLDADGKELEVQKQGWWRSGESASWTYSFKKEVKEFTLEATLWKETKVVDVAVKHEIAVGF